MEKLAIFGGEKVKNTPFQTGKRFGAEELLQLEEALNQNTLFYWHGNKVKQFNEKFAKMYGVKHCVATTSGTASIHVALGALGVTEGDEVITTPISDMGSVIGILYQNAIPIFADVDPHTYNISPKSIEEKISSKTKAIVVVHLAGNPADMDEIMEIAKKYNVKVIEDCAQSYMCRYRGRLAGTIGDMGCFSLNDFKHISAGDGGMVLVNDESLYEDTLKFADKNYDRLSTGDSMRNIEFLAPNYRMSELQGAVGLAQLDKLKNICAKRKEYGDRITREISNIKGIYPHRVKEGNSSSYWFYMMRINSEEMNADSSEFAAALTAEGVPAQQGYIPMCIYEYNLFKNKQGYKGTNSPFDSKYYGKEISYTKGMCPTAEAVLETAVKFAINEFYSEKDIDDIINAIKKVAAYYHSKK